MATELDVLSAISQLGFESLGNVFFGTWQGYAITLRKLSAKIFYLDAAVRLDKVPKGLRKELARAVKEKGLKIGGTEAITKQRVSFSVSFKGKDEALPRLRERLDAVTAALRDNGVTPAGTCAVSGAARPDSLCLVNIRGALSYQPVNAAAIREQGNRTREKAEANETNGSYLLGIVGAVLGALVGLIPNLLLLLLTETLYSLVFALVPICAMYGYKLFRGKMNNAAIVVVIVVSLIAVPLIPYLEIVVYLVQEYGVTLSQAISAATVAMTDGEFLAEIAGELVQLVMFMALGIWVAWRFMSNQTNSSAVQNSEAQLASLRPNPAHQQMDDAYPQY